jgi:hypothetical protein
MAEELGHVKANPTRAYDRDSLPDGCLLLKHVDVGQHLTNL